MPTVADKKNVYSTIYTAIDFSTEREVQKKETIPAREGKRIRIEKLSILFQVATAGVEGTCIVTAEVNGKQEKLATFTTRNTKYEEQVKAVDFITGSGQPVIIRWYLITTGPARSRMTNVAYIFSYVSQEKPGTPADPEPVETTEPVTIMIMCDSRTDAESLAGTIKASVGNRPISIWGQLV